MHYISTRGHAPKKNFLEVLTSGLAADGGLYVPSEWPIVSRETIQSWKELSYTDLAVEVMLPFTGGMLDKPTLKRLVDKSYAVFRDEDIVPLRPLEDGHYVLELFHGPTLAFKDVALQFLGNLLEYELKQRDEHIVIIGATSGDTGSAAISGVLGCEHIQLFMLYPHLRVSEVQRRQMTTIDAGNIHNLAVGDPGNFDDCQDMVKHMFRHPEFMGETKLVAVNSINWVRILAQIVYYFYAALKLGAPAQKVSFSVPTGNFGDIFAGYVAKKMGLPIDRLVVATNRNDILDRCIRANDYRKEGVQPSFSPSMDIQISSNFERLLFDAYAQDAGKIRQLMDGFKADGKLTIAPEVMAQIQHDFVSLATDDDQTVEVMKQVYDAHGYVVDPHTATGVRAAWEYKQEDVPMVTLATAHAAKFPDVTERALGFRPELPAHLADLFNLPEHFTNVPNRLDAVQEWIKRHTA